MSISIDSCDNNCVYLLKEALYDRIIEALKEDKNLVILCIGTDRSTGDSLGPLVGYKLANLSLDNVTLYGNLFSPTHAKNLHSVIEEIKSKIKNPYIIAVDACLGNLKNVGKIFLHDSPIIPGAALSKNLPPIGDISITGIVNISGAMEFVVLQNTRLYTVMLLADIISRSLHYSIKKAQKEFDLYTKI